MSLDELEVSPLVGKVRQKKIVLQSSIKPYVKKGLTVYTDDLQSYQGLTEYDHEAVSHSVGEYVRGMAHTNGLNRFGHN